AVRELTVSCSRLDLPRVRDALAPGDGAARPGIGEKDRSFLRTGALPPLPSLAVDRAALSCNRLILSRGSAVDGIEIAGGVELRRGREPELRLDAAASDAGGAWRLEDASLACAPARDEYSGRGVLGLAQGSPLYLRLRGLGGHRFELGLGATAATGPAGSPGLEAIGELGGVGGSTRTVNLAGRFLTPGPADLTAWPALAEPLAKLPPLANLGGTFSCGMVWSDAGPDIDLDLTLDPNDWCDGGRLALRYGGGRARLDTLAVAAAGLALTGSAALADGALEASAELVVRGTGWLELLQPGATPPDSLAVDMALRCSGRLPSPALTAALGGGLRAGAARVDSFEIDLGVDEGWTEARSGWSLRAHGLSAAGALDLTRDTYAVTVRTTPLQVARAGNLDAAAARGLPRNGLIDVATDVPAVTFTDVEITGALGEIALDGGWDPTGFEARIDAAWPDPPDALALALPASSLDSLRAHWRDGALWSLVLHAVQENDILDAVADLRLPGPRHLAGLLPQNLEIEDLGALEGTARLRRAGEILDLDADLSRTGWIDVGRVAARAFGDSLVLDDLRLEALGVELRADGGADGDGILADALVTVADALRLARMAGAQLDVRAEARLAFHVEGSRTSPDLACDLAASYAGAGISAPEIAGRIELSGGSLSAVLSAPAGIAAGGRHLDIAEAGYAGAVPGRGEGRLSLWIDGPELSALAGLVATLADTATVTGDTLTVALAGRALALDRSFTLELDRATGCARLRGLSMSGDLGYLHLDADHVPGDDPAGELDLELNLPDGIYPPELPAALRPHALTVVAHSRASARRARIDARGLVLGARRDLVATALVEAAASGLDAVITVLDQGDTLAVAVAATTREALASLRAGGDTPLHVDLTLNGLPLPSLPGADWQGREVVLHGAAALRGTTAAPTGHLDLSASARGWPELAAHRLDVSADLTAPGATPGGLDADLALVRADKHLAQGRLSVPGTASLSPPAFAPGEDGGFDAEFETHDLQLDEFTPLLPVAVGVQGRLDLVLGASGSPRNPDLQGRLSIRDGRATLPDGSWITLTGASDLQGKLSAPSVTGALEITGGVLRLPDPPQDLHPVNARP
ncbi:hypothetical protein KKG45_12565, partial [bacterium]|nr:hypothetical protein [bacterium]